MPSARSFLVFVLVSSFAPGAFAEEKPKWLPLPRSGWVLLARGRVGRQPILVDALEAIRRLGQPICPSIAETLRLPEGSTRQWSRLEAAAYGVFRHPD